MEMSGAATSASVGVQNTSWIWMYVMKAFGFIGAETGRFFDWQMQRPDENTEQICASRSIRRKERTHSWVSSMLLLAWFGMCAVQLSWMYKNCDPKELSPSGCTSGDAVCSSFVGGYSCVEHSVTLVFAWALLSFGLAFVGLSFCTPILDMIKGSFTSKVGEFVHSVPLVRKLW